MWQVGRWQINARISSQRHKTNSSLLLFRRAWCIDLKMSKGKLNCKISSNIDDLELLSKEHAWLGLGKASIRPNELVLEEKRRILGEEVAKYSSVEDYLINTIFTKEKPLRIFLPNRFAYDLPRGTHHYVMWYRRGKPADELINFHINYELSQLGADFEYAYYENPKMTFPEIYRKP